MTASEPVPADSEQRSSVCFVSGHLDVDATEFALHYTPALSRAANHGLHFVVGDARGADARAIEWLDHRGAPFTVFHMFSAPRHSAPEASIRGGFVSDEERDAAMTAASDCDLAWVRPGRECSGTAQNLRRRQPPLPVRITQAGLDDWDRCRSVRLTALAHAPDAYGSTLEGESSQGPEFWRRRAGNAQVDTFLATAGVLDVGIAVVAPEPATADRGWVYGVWVSGDFRGRGAGDGLMRAAISAATERGYRELVLEVGVDNAAARRLYERNGFSGTGRMRTLAAPREHITEEELRRPL